LWVVLDNAHEVFEGKACLQATSLSSGACLQRVEQDVELEPGQRRLVLELDTRALHVEDTLITAEFGGTTTFRLLSEPKAAQLPTTTLRATPMNGAVRIDASGPVVDLFVWDPTDRVQLLDNFVTLPQGGSVVLRANGPVPQLCARSLAGLTPVAQSQPRS
jgi:hypothetical protein